MAATRYINIIGLVIVSLIAAGNGKIFLENSLRNRQTTSNTPNAEDPLQHESQNLNNDVRGQEETAGSGNRDIINEQIQDDFDNEQKMRWVLLTTRYRKKHRLSNFDGIVLNNANIMGSLSLEKSWKRDILAVLKKKKEIVRTQGRRAVLKSATGNELTILSNDVTMSNEISSSHGYNITCEKTENYTCTMTVKVKRIVPCWWAPEYRCLEDREELQSGICRRKIQVCCAGFTVQASGYCEREVIQIKPAFPPSQTQCGGLLTSQEGEITSPNYPDVYPNDKNCEWWIRAPTGYKVVLKVVDIGLEDPVGACDLRHWNCYKLCEFDRLKILDVAARTTKTLCGHLSPSSQYVSTGSDVKLTFTSDISSGGKGFRIIYALASEYQLSTHHQCTGGKTWQICHHRCARSCTPHNNQTHILCLDSEQKYPTIPSSRRNEVTCVPGCACPPSSPILENGVCIKPESCPGNFFKCGKPAVPSKLKIVGGRTAGKFSWPWMVQLESDSGFHVCGATLICSNWVLTAAHCFLSFDATSLDLSPERYLVNVGKYWKNEQMDSRVVQTYMPELIISHPKYKIETDNNDLALIRLSHAVDVTDYARPACLPHRILPGVTSETSYYAPYQQPTVGTTCTVLGWGTTRNIGPNSQQLKEASITVKAGNVCVYDFYVWRLMICAGGHKDQDTCRGDSGGPLLCKRNGGKWYVDGVTSFGDSCGDEDVPGGYTRVSNYIDWIRGYIGTKCGV